MSEPERWARLPAGAAAERAARPRRICERCAAALAVTGAGISLVSSTGNRGVVCSTDDISGRIEDLQVTLGEGPCIDAVRGGAPVLVADLDDAVDVAVERWPAFMDAVVRAGVRAVFAFPLQIGAIGIGALDLYRTSPGTLDDGQIATALQAADAAATAVLDLDFGVDESSLAGLDPTTRYQLQVHQATGMVKVQLGSTIEQALLRLRAHAFSTSRPLIDVAVDVVEGRLRFSPEER